MLKEDQLIAYLEKTLSPIERERVEAELEREPELRRQLIQQQQLDGALRVMLSNTHANERVKLSVLAVVSGEKEEAIKRQVLHDTTSPSLVIRDFVFSIFRRPAWAFGLAACLCIFFGVWFATRSNSPSELTLAIETPKRVELPSGIIIPKSGDTIRMSDSGSGTMTFADGTVLHLEPGTEIIFQSVANPPRRGGKQIKLISGSVSADVTKQPAGLPLLIQTPHALVTVVGTEFDLAVSPNQTELEVTHGLVKMAGAGATQQLSVAEGEFAVASPNAAMQYGKLARNPFLWPFSSTSIWNQPLGSGASFAAVPGKSFLEDGPLIDSLRSRRPFMGSAADPLRRIFVKGEARADIRLNDANLPDARLADSIVLMQHARRYALELRDVTVRLDGDLEAADMERLWLNGSGVMRHQLRVLPFGLSNLGGLLRANELKNGIRHALSARISRDRLAGRDFANPLTVWPAADAVASDNDENKIRVGALLAIPPDVDIRAITGDTGMAFELARAMQDYGIYVTGFGNAPFVLLADNARIPSADEFLTKLVPLLQVVTNNSAEMPGGGGTPRREFAPALPGETK